MRAKFHLSVMLAVGAVVMTAGSAMAAEQPSGQRLQTGPSATLEGRAIPLSAVAALPCHDFEYPVIRCFRAVDGLLAAIGLQNTGNAKASVTALSVSTGYVIAYDQFYYGGSNPKVLSSDQAWLVFIGWNDVTSSFKSFGATGRWWENSPNGGFVYSYGSSTQVPVLSSTYNNKFSAFEID
ncbi:MAG: hypothetical protein H0W29_18615 [Gemmatimonadales bacterium]|nr:hypothetical protein [Gemmatimonadales bacterium]